MAPGIPDKVSQFHKKFVIGRPQRERLMALLYRNYLTLYLKITLFRQYRDYSAPIKPLKLLWVDPQKIIYSSSSSAYENWFVPQIKGGDWYNDKTKFSNNIVFRAIKSHYENGTNWKETELYEHRKENDQRPDKRISKIENLYSKISDEGYKTQRELDDYKRSTSNPESLNHLLREFNEVTVSIGPQGEFYFNVGQHRLSIAKILGLDRIPVRVLLRHEKWQQEREKAVKSPDKLSEELKNHPDIEYLINQN